TDAVLAEALARPLAGVPVASHLADAVALDQLRELGNHGLGRERRPPLTQRVHHDHVLLTMPYRQRHAVDAAPRRIDEAVVPHALPRHPPAHARRHARFHRLARDKAFDVAAELRKPLSLRTRRVLLQRRVNDALRYARIHLTRRGLPHQDRI